MDIRIDCSLINLKKSKVASIELNSRPQKIVCITEPYTSHGNVAFLDKAAGTVYYAIGKSPRAAIRISPSLNPWIVPEFTDRDICTVAAKMGEKLTYISSVYLDINLTVRNAMMIALIEKCNAQGIALVLAMDSNAHSAIWGSPESNRRGEEMEDIIAEKDLKVHNVGQTPTFQTTRAESIIDVVLTNHHVNDNLNLTEWRVDTSRPSFSDHRYINFTLGSYVPTENWFRNLKRANWGVFKAMFNIESSPNVEQDGSNIDACAEWLESMTEKALEAACPLRRAMPRRPNSWWTEELTERKQKLRHFENVKRNSPANLERYKKEWRDYRKAIDKAKKDSWKRFCSDAESAKDVSSILKMLRTKSLPGIGILKKGGVPVSTPHESLEVLMDVHFPDSTPAGGTREVPATEMSTTNLVEEEVMEYITRTKVRYSLKSFGPKKAPGPDGFRPAILQNYPEVVLDYLSEIYKAALRSGVTPNSWRQMKVIFLPKPDKADYGEPKAYRPVTLSNFLLKGLERIVQWYIEEKVITKPLTAQHAYTVGRSTDTALSEVMDFIERGVEQNQTVLGVSLDCSSAFDSIKFSSAKKAMERKNIPTSITSWYYNLLKSRQIKADLQGTLCVRTPQRGSSQGGVLSPKIWNLIMDTLLSNFNRSPVKAVGYADDIILLVAGKDPATLVDVMQKELNRVLNWGKDNGLTFNPDKTSAVRFSKYKRKRNWKQLHMENEALEYSASMKYLGTIITQHLSWTEQVKGRVCKAMKVLHNAKSIIGQNWGLNPEKILWIHTAIVRPTISYGSLVWARSINDTMRSSLSRVQRHALLAMAPTLRSTPTAGMEAALGLLPLDLHVESEALKARIRTRDSVKDTWDGIGNKCKGHRRTWDDKLGEVCPQNLPMDRTTQSFNWEERTEIQGKPDVIVYTDGSREEDISGAGWMACVEDQVVGEDSIYLGKESTVFQAEVTAIDNAIHWLLDNMAKYANKSCLIRSDSQSAIQAIYSHEVTSKMVRDCIDSLKEVNQQAHVRLEWVKGHADETGNEFADYLAKQGNLQKPTCVEPILPVPYTNVKLRIKEMKAEQWQKRWDSKPGHRCSKVFCPSTDEGKIKRLIKLSRNELSLYVQATTGHGLFAGHLAKWRDIDPQCKLCLEEDETADHLWLECPALERVRFERRADTRTKEEIKILNFFKTKAITKLMEENSGFLSEENQQEG